MSLSTVVVCDSEEKSKEIISLVKSQPDLSFVETVGRQTASEHIATIHPKLVWLELAPEPLEAINLLSELRGRNPSTYFLVSYETLNADLVKATMQLGAFDYLDSQTWQEQLPDAITRMLSKEKAAQENSAARPEVGSFTKTEISMPAASAGSESKVTASASFGSPVTTSGSFGSPISTSGSFGSPASTSSSFGSPTSTSGSFEPPASDRTSYEQPVSEDSVPNAIEIINPGWPIWVVPVLVLILLSVFAVAIFLR